MKKTRLYSIVLMLALTLGVFFTASAAILVTPTPGSATIDGVYSDWDLSATTKIEMGEPSGTLLSDAYIKYDCENEVFYVLVLLKDGFQIEPGSDGGSNWIKVYDFAPSLQKIVSADSGNDGTPPDFSWVLDAQQAQVGWEVSAPLASGSYNEVEIHAQVDDENPDSSGRTSSSDIFSLNVTCFDYGDLPDETGKFEGYTLYDTGARHEKGDLFLGVNITKEVNGKPDPNAAKDEYDDGIVPIGNWGDGDGHVQVTVTGDGCLYGWFDYNNGITNDPDYSFSQVDEEIVSGEMVYEVNNPTILDFNLPIGDIQGNYFARFRLFDESYCQTAVNLAADPPPLYQGLAVNGEVEDYYWTFGTNAVSMAGFSASSENLPMIWIAVSALFSIAGITVFAWMRRRTA